MRDEKSRHRLCRLEDESNWVHADRVIESTTSAAAASLFLGSTFLHCLTTSIFSFFLDFVSFSTHGAVFGAASAACSGGFGVLSATCAVFGATSAACRGGLGLFSATCAVFSSSTASATTYSMSRQAEAAGAQQTSYSQTSE